MGFQVFIQQLYHELLMTEGSKVRFSTFLKLPDGVLVATVAPSEGIVSAVPFDSGSVGKESSQITARQSVHGSWLLNIAGIYKPGPLARSYTLVTHVSRGQ